MSSAYALTSSRLGVVGRRRAPTPPLWLLLAAPTLLCSRTSFPWGQQGLPRTMVM